MWFADRTAHWAGAVCFLVGALIATAIALFLRRPIPQVHDEWSYLLAADTFAHGYWTNPALPVDIRSHFEALHILVAPSYMSKYPPGQGLFLAVGQLIGDPIYSLWLGGGLAAASCCWMLRAYLPRRWAYLGGLLCALHPLVLKWSQSFWGGDLALIGGFLLWGGVGRLWQGKSTAIGNALALSIGIALLANSRPYEGFCVTFIVAIPLACALLQGLKESPRIWLRQLIAPTTVVLATVAALMLTYNFRVTGNPLTMPYVLHEKMYGVAPLFLFQPLKPVPETLRHDSMRVINARATVRDYRMQRTAPVRAAWAKSMVLFRAAFQQFDLTAYWLDAPHRVALWQRVLHFFLLLPLVGAFVAARRRVRAGTRFALIALPVFVALVCAETFINPHYGAPAGCFVALLLVDGLRHLQVLRFRGRRVGLAVSRAVVALYLTSFVYHLSEFASPRWHRWIVDRRPILRLLERFPGKKVVLVYYGNEPLPLSRNQEWVYNGSDLDAPSVLWARYLTPAENTHLLSRFAEREPWVIDATDPDRTTLYRYHEFVSKNRPTEGAEGDAGSDVNRSR